MSASTNDLVKLIAEIAEVRGFVRRKTTWYRRHDEVTSVCYLEKSQWGGQYGINLSVAINALSFQEYPREETCHIRAGLEWVVTGNESGSHVLDIQDSSMTPQERDDQIRAWIVKGLDWLDMMSSISAIIERLRSNEVLQERTTLRARQFLGVGSTGGHSDT